MLNYLSQRHVCHKTQISRARGGMLRFWLKFLPLLVQVNFLIAKLQSVAFGFAVLQKVAPNVTTSMPNTR